LLLVGIDPNDQRALLVRAQVREDLPPKRSAGRRWLIESSTAGSSAASSRTVSHGATRLSVAMARSWGDLLGEDAVEETEQERAGVFSRLRDSLSKSRRALAQQLAVAAFDPADDEAWERLEEALIAADLGVPATAEIVRRLEARGGLTSLEEPLVEELAALLGEPGMLDVAARPSVVLVVGVNGTGKTTTIGKLAAKLAEHGRSVLLAAADTFRAAAEEQLEIWAQRAGADFVGSARGGDPAAVAYDAIEAATARGRDVVIVDTAGRLHTQTNLMDELAKVRRVIAGKLEGAPHETLLVVDATTGQNGLQQARLFGQAVDVTGVALTKLDGSAKGGIGVAIAYELGLPVKLVGIGEGLDDLRPFDPEDFARALVAG
jgi:fused signal recognition particle receptor